MKNYIIGIALALALVMGATAFAETAEPATDPVPAATEETMAGDAEAPAANPDAEAPAAEEAQADDGTALREALDAFRSAKASSRIDELAEELNGYVEAGSMTQEQADLILNSAKEQLAARDGECPSCGYKLQGGAPRMDGRMGRRGGRMQDMMPNGQMPGNQQSDAQGGAAPQPGAGMPGGQQSGNQAPGGQQAPQR